MKSMFYFFMSLFPERDHADRHAVSITFGNIKGPSPSSSFDYHNHQANSIEIIWRTMRLMNALPIKIAANHIVLDSSTRNSPLFLPLKLSQRKSRYNYHFGSYLEVQYELRRFGIDTSLPSVPIDFNGVLSVENHQEWILQRRRQEEEKGCMKIKAVRRGHFQPESKHQYHHQQQQRRQEQQEQIAIDLGDAFGLGTAIVVQKKNHVFVVGSDDAAGALVAAMSSTTIPVAAPPTTTPATTAATTLVACDAPMPDSMKKVAVVIKPTETDVLFGRGMYTQSHSGNVRFRKILEGHFGSYSGAVDDFDKSVIIECICDDMMMKEGIRFLKQSTADVCYWTFVTDKKAIHTKIAQTFRSIRAAKRRQEYNHHHQQQQQQQQGM
jgi:hypothetical protein